MVWMQALSASPDFARLRRPAPSRGRRPRYGRPSAPVREPQAQSSRAPARPCRRSDCGYCRARSRLCRGRRDDRPLWRRPASPRRAAATKAVIGSDGASQLKQIASAHEALLRSAPECPFTACGASPPVPCGRRRARRIRRGSVRSSRNTLSSAPACKAGGSRVGRVTFPDADVIEFDDHRIVIVGERHSDAAAVAIDVAFEVDTGRPRHPVLGRDIGIVRIFDRRRMAAIAAGIEIAGAIAKIDAEPKRILEIRKVRIFLGADQKLHHG